MTEKIETMSKETLELHFKNISTQFQGLNEIFSKMEVHIQAQYKKLIVLEENVKHSKIDLCHFKKNMRWSIGVVVPFVTAGIYFVANYFA